jgi:hypothetical protein
MQCRVDSRVFAPTSTPTLARNFIASFLEKPPTFISASLSVQQKISLDLHLPTSKSPNL